VDKKRIVTLLFPALNGGSGSNVANPVEGSENTKLMSVVSLTLFVLGEEV
jgi:hypothetical protein